MDNSGLFRRDRQGRRGRGVALCVTEELECLELTAGNGAVESLWIRVKRQTNNADVTVGVCSGPPSQDSDTDKLFFEELRGDSLVNCPDELQPARNYLGSSHSWYNQGQKVPKTLSVLK